MRKNNVALAYFINGNFEGWHSDSFGTMTKSKPKLYGYSESQIATITKNIRYKIKTMNERTFDEDLKNSKHIGEALSTLVYSSGDSMRGHEVELRVVQTPFFDGPNPLHSNKISNKFRKHHTKMYHEWCKMNGLDPGIETAKKRFGIGLIENYKKFEAIYPDVSSNNWIYSDYKEVSKWALNEPTKFLEIIKPM